MVKMGLLFGAVFGCMAAALMFKQGFSPKFCMEMGALVSLLSIGIYLMLMSRARNIDSIRK